MARPNFLPDNFTLAMAGTVLFASFFPCSGEVAGFLGKFTNVVICLLFFLHGAKLPREAVVSGLTHWRLHLLVMLSTFVLFPLLGLLLKPVLSPLVTPGLYMGILFLCALPSTVQSSIAFTSVAKGNVPAAICSASASNLIGIFLTPLLIGLITAGHASGQSPLDSVVNIALQLLLPFIAGQFARRYIGRWVDRNRSMVKVVDQGSILLIVYTAFSEAIVQGLWHQLPGASLAGLVLINLCLLGLVMFITTFTSRRLRFNGEDEIAIVFCGSKKSLASGIPMAKVLFAGHALGTVVLPLMLFHQMQLMVCALLARRYATRAPKEVAA